MTADKNTKGIRNAWLSPTGEFITRHEKNIGLSAFHMCLALAIIADMENLATSQDAFEWLDEEGRLGYGDNASDYLERLGWIRLHSFQQAIEPQFLITSKGISSAQEDAILEWCESNQKKYSESVKFPEAHYGAWLKK